MCTVKPTLKDVLMMGTVILLGLIVINNLNGCAQDTPTTPAAADKAKGEGLGASFIVGGAIVQVEVFADTPEIRQDIMQRVSLAMAPLMISDKNNPTPEEPE